MYVEERRVKTSKSSKRWKRLAVLQCDQCQKLFERPAGAGNIDKGNHFCSIDCSQAAHAADGVLRSKMIHTMTLKYGADWAKTNAKKALSTQTDEDIKKRTQKASQTIKDRYGVKSAVQIPHVRAACLEAAASPESIEKRKHTMLERYGVEYPMRMENAYTWHNTPEACSRRHESMKKNGTYGTSMPEELLYKLLVEKFGFEKVVRQHVVSHDKGSWSIDFYVREKELYVQLDGEYWHGLDRPLDDIKMYKTPRDLTIIRTVETDKSQNEWFQSRGLRLIRVTDKQILRGELPDGLK